MLSWVFNFLFFDYKYPMLRWIVDYVATIYYYSIVLLSHGLRSFQLLVSDVILSRWLRSLNYQYPILSWVVNSVAFNTWYPTLYLVVNYVAFIK